jgi:hypothetical protein
MPLPSASTQSESERRLDDERLDEERLDDERLDDERLDDPRPFASTKICKKMTTRQISRDLILEQPQK